MDSTSPTERDDRGRTPGDDDPATERQATSAMAWLLLYSTAMFTLPFAAFYGTRYVLTHLEVDGFPNTCGSVAAAVLVVNVIILCYALRGYEDAKEDDHHEPDGRTDKEESKKAK